MDEKFKIILTELSRRLQALYGLRLIRLILYGSQARGDAKPGSDIDVLVVLEGPVNPFEEIHRTGKSVAELSLAYDEVVSCVFISSEQYEREQSPLLINVRREGITAWSSSQADSPLTQYKLRKNRGDYLTGTKGSGDSSQRSPLMTPEQLALLGKANDSLKAARLLADQGFYDFATSRAYYAMFYVASALLLGQGFTFSKHSTVVALFGQHLAKTGQVPIEFHQYLIEAMKVRHVGDYTTKPVDSAEARLQITRAEQFLELAQQHLDPTPPP